MGLKRWFYATWLDLEDLAVNEPWVLLSMGFTAIVLILAVITVYLYSF